MIDSTFTIIQMSKVLKGFLVASNCFPRCQELGEETHNTGPDNTSPILALRTHKAERQLNSVALYITCLKQPTG